MRNIIRTVLLFLFVFVISTYAAAEQQWLARDPVPRDGKILILWEDGTITNPHLGQSDLAVAVSKEGEKKGKGDNPTILKGTETPNGYMFRIFDKQIAPRDNYPFATFSLPQRNQIQSAQLIITAYNDDRTWTRAVSFHLDGIGGYLGSSRIAPTQVTGEGVLNQKQKKSWAYDLANTKVSGVVYGSNNVNFLDILKGKEEHTIKAAVSTYMTYGPNSWLTLDLVIKYKN